MARVSGRRGSHVEKASRNIQRVSPESSADNLSASVCEETPEAGERTTQEIKVNTQGQEITQGQSKRGIIHGDPSVCLGGEAKLDLDYILSVSAQQTLKANLKGLNHFQVI